MSEKLKKAGDFDANPPIGVKQYDNSMKCFCAAYDQIFFLLHAYLKAELTDNARILVVGAGTGAEVCTFGDGNPSWSITGVDPSAQMLSLAKSKLQQQGIANVELVMGYTNELSEDKLYEAATCVLVMHFLEDDGSKLSLLQDISKRLKKGALFLLIDAFGDRDSFEFNRTLAAWKKYVTLMGVDEKTVDDGFNNQILQRLKFVPEERIKVLLEEAGFENPTRFYTGFLYGGWAAWRS